MAAAQMMEEVRERFGGLFRSGSRYQWEKIGVLLVYLLLVVATSVWSFSSDSADNELGATFGSENLKEIDKEIFFLENTSEETWTNVNVIVNEVYRHKVEKVEPRDRLILEPTDLQYFFYVPRGWGGEDWERLAKKDKHNEHAEAGMDLRFIQVRATQGKLDVDADAPQPGKGAASATEGEGGKEESEE